MPHYLLHRFQRNILTKFTLDSFQNKNKGEKRKKQKQDLCIKSEYVLGIRVNPILQQRFLA